METGENVLSRGSTRVPSVLRLWHCGRRRLAGFGWMRWAAWSFSALLLATSGLGYLAHRHLDPGGGAPGAASSPSSLAPGPSGSLGASPPAPPVRT